MGFERFNLYKRQASFYTGAQLTTNELAIKLKEECPYDWIKVRNNTKKTYKGEKRVENWNPKTNQPDPNSIWVWRPTDSYDSTLFSLLYIQFQGLIYNTYLSIKNYIDVDEYLDEVEKFLFQCIRHFDPENKASFKSLAYRMIKASAINCVNKYTIQHMKKDKEGNILKDSSGKKIKEIEYKLAPQSLEQILEAEDGSKYCLPSITDNYSNNLFLLKSKYKENQDFLSWLIVDICSDDSEILNNTKLDLPINYPTHKKFSLIKIKELKDKILDSKLYIDLGFENISLELYKNKFKKEYKKSIATLSRDVKDFGISE